MVMRERVLHVSEYTWKAEKDGVKHYAAVQGIKVSTLVDSGDRETSGGATILARHFLERDKWKNYFKDVYGEKIYIEIYKAVEREYLEYSADPAAYNKQRQADA